VSAVNYGANPYTNVAARQTELMQDLRRLPEGAKREAVLRMTRELDKPEEPPTVEELRAEVAPTVEEARASVGEVFGASIEMLKREFDAL